MFRLSNCRPISVLVTVMAFSVLLITGCSQDRAATSNVAEPAVPAGSEQLAELREVTLSVPGMDCPLCPITVRRALSGVEGVSEAEADLQTREARVRFDPARTGVEHLIAAVKQAGFTATLTE